MNAWVVAPSYGLFLTFGESERLKITLICLYIQNYLQEQIGQMDYAAFSAFAS
jgi:hypothetical protein